MRPLCISYTRLVFIGCVTLLAAQPLLALYALLTQGDGYFLVWYYVLYLIAFFGAIALRNRLPQGSLLKRYSLWFLAGSLIPIFVLISLPI